MSKIHFKGDDDKNKTVEGFRLNDITCTMRRGKITAIVGDVGSGKSSLVAALLGQMKQISGERKLYGSVCYVPQEAWLLNMSFRENIIFGTEFDPEHYKKTIEVCALERDIKLMADGDLTEIGERGTNLSGGQRQRISLARAVYKYSDIILLDDPLSAVDQHVGKHIFEKCIVSYLKEKQKSVIFVTHQLQYLSKVDEVIVIKNNRICEMGSYDELMKLKGHLYLLVGENAETSGQIDEESYEEGELGSETSGTFEAATINKSRNSLRTENELQLNGLALPPIKENGSTHEQFLNRQQIIENHQSTLISTDANSRKGYLEKIKRNRVGIASNVSENPQMFTNTIKEEYDAERGIVMPEDAAPMKLVLEDQSLTYKKSPFLTYLQAGSGVIITLIVFAYFFAVHVVRILSGKTNHLEIKVL